MRKEFRSPQRTEIRDLLTKTGELWPVTSPWRPFVITALFTGLRASELRGLVWDCVDFEKKRHPRPAACRLSEQDGQPEVEGRNARRAVGADGGQHVAAMAACLPQDRTRARLPHQAWQRHRALAEPHRIWNQLLEALELPRLSLSRSAPCCGDRCSSSRAGRRRRCRPSWVIARIQDDLRSLWASMGNAGRRCGGDGADRGSTPALSRVECVHRRHRSRNVPKLDMPLTATA